MSDRVRVAFDLVLQHAGGFEWWVRPQTPLDALNRRCVRASCRAADFALDVAILTYAGLIRSRLAERRVGDALRWDDLLMGLPYQIGLERGRDFWTTTGHHTANV